MHSKWIKCISTQGNVRGVSIQATELVQQLAELHQLTGEPAHGFAEAVMGALLISSYCKGGERINLNIQGSGRIKQALVDAYPDGSVRGYVTERDGEIDFGDRGPWGQGMLSVLRAKEGSREQPYIGTVPLVTGHLPKDLTFYWVQSEQIPSAVGLAVTMERGRITAAGGFLVQILPGASPDEIKAIDRHVHEIHSLAQAVAEHQDPTYLLSQIFQSTAFVLLEDRPLVFRCTCSWERVTRALALVGVEELSAMLAEDQSAEVRCDFCTKTYKVDAKGLRELISVAGGGSASSGPGSAPTSE
jgi:molecular chaperone Hsp33